MANVDAADLESDSSLELEEVEHDSTPSSVSTSIPSTSTESDTSSCPVAVSLLTRLRCPQPADISRKQKVSINPPPQGKRRSGGRGNFNPQWLLPGIV